MNVISGPTVQPIGVYFLMAIVVWALLDCSALFNDYLKHIMTLDSFEHSEYNRIKFTVINVGYVL